MRGYACKETEDCSVLIENSRCWSIWWHWPGKCNQLVHDRKVRRLLTPRLQPLSLLLKACPLVDHLSLYDVVNTPGVTADLSHISSVAKIEGYLPADDGMKKALTGADMVIIPAGIPRT